MPEHQLHAHPCPNCGYCPCCGRSNHFPYPVPQWWYPAPVWPNHQRYVWTCNTTTTTGAHNG